MNGTLTGFDDPIDTRVGWFELGIPSCRVVRGETTPRAPHGRIDATLQLLGLRDCCLQRKRYVEDCRFGPYAKGIDLTYLEHRAPFITAELQRQGQLVRGDT